MYTFKDFNEDSATIIDDETFRPGRYLKTTGLPEGFSELPSGFFIYMVVSLGRVQFISAGIDPWGVAEKFRSKFKADRVLYRRASVDTAWLEVENLIEKYHPPYNYKPQSAQLAELDTILES